MNIEERIEKIDEHIDVLNREVGELVGELRAIKWIMGGGFLVMIFLQFAIQ